jgi:hypothetical protein
MGVDGRVTINRFAARADSNRAAIVAALRSAGATVYDLRRPVDLLVGFRGQTILVEIKRPAGPKGGTSKRGFTPAQSAFLATWNGGAIARVDSVDAALRSLGILKTSSAVAG